MITEVDASLPESSSDRYIAGCDDQEADASATCDSPSSELKKQHKKKPKEERVTFYKSRGFTFTDHTMEELVRSSEPAKKP